MPALNKKKAKSVADAEGGKFALVPTGLYPGILREVIVKEGPKGEYWRWEYQIPEDYETGANQKFWDNTSLSDAADWKMKQVFEAFGVPADTHTDELIGHKVLMRIGIGTIQSGDRAGEDTNQINEVLPFDEDADEDTGGF